MYLTYLPNISVSFPFRSWFFFSISSRFRNRPLAERVVAARRLIINRLENFSSPYLTCLLVATYPPLTSRASVLFWGWGWDGWMDGWMDIRAFPPFFLSRSVFSRACVRACVRLTHSLFPVSPEPLNPSRRVFTCVRFTDLFSFPYFLSAFYFPYPPPPLYPPYPPYPHTPPLPPTPNPPMG